MSSPISFSSYQTQPSNLEHLKKRGWYALNFSLGTLIVLLTIGFLAQIHVLHHIGNTKLSQPTKSKLLLSYVAVNSVLIGLSACNLNYVYQQGEEKSNLQLFVIKPQVIQVKDRDGNESPLSFYGILAGGEPLKSLQEPFLKGPIDEEKIVKTIQGFHGTIAIQYKSKIYVNHGERVGMYTKNSFALGTSKGVIVIDLQESIRLILASYDFFNDSEYFQEIMQYNHEYFGQKIQDVKQLKHLALLRLQRSNAKETAITTIDIDLPF